MTPIIWLPPISSDERVFDQVAAQLPAGQTVLPGNMPGYGRKPYRDCHSMTDLAKSIIADLDAAGVDKVWACGHSIGGMVALELAAIAPERLAGLILSGTTPRFGSRDGTFQKAFLKDRLGMLEDGGSMEDVAQEAPGSMLKAGTDPAIGEEIIRLYRDVPEAAYRNALRCIVTFDRADDIAGIDLPTLVLSGTDDTYAPHKTMVRMAETIPGAKLVTFDGVSHMAPLEVPEQFAKEVADFIAANS